MPARSPGHGTRARHGAGPGRGRLLSTFYVGYGELAPWFRGSIDEVAYYDVALTPDRVFQHWLADPPPGDLEPVGGGTGGSGGSGSRATIDAEIKRTKLRRRALRRAKRPRVVVALRSPSGRILDRARTR